MSEPIEAFPLCWPAGRKRTSWRESAPFKTTFSRARDAIVREVELLTGTRCWGSANVVISTNIPLRRDGLPLANQRKPDDVGVAVYFTYKQQQRCFACDRWDKIEDNMQAIAKTIDALRGIARWGTGDMLDAAFTGFAALPAPGAAREWWEVLGVARTASIDEARAAYRRAASEAHPDRGGDDARMAEVNRAWQQAQDAA
ncbi:MAG: DnaJ domain-containing protein [Burkholderiaceae bacterium]|nr:DnaJ domain-containing protein [Burkholderiaceae bacterium]